MRLSRLIPLSIITLSVLSGCTSLGNTVSEHGERVSQDVDVGIVTATTEDFPDANITQYENITDKTLESNGVPYPYLVDGAEDAFVKINDTIAFVLSEYCDTFVGNSTFDIGYRIATYDETMLSIVYSGSVYTPAKAINVLFTMNFDLLTGEQMTLADFTDEERVLTALEEKAYTLVQGEEDVYIVPPHIAYASSELIFGDRRHAHDFYWEANALYICTTQSNSFRIYKLGDVFEE